MSENGELTLILTGDVMTGRGIDQILPHPASPELYESYMRSAEHYVALAERVSGPIPRRVSPSYIWGDALAAFSREAADLRIINLETSVTRSDAYERKGINYRMSPDNVSCLLAANIDCCVLANNHVLDWGQDGLLETLGTLKAAGLRYAGAGVNRLEAEVPSIMEVPGKPRVLVFGFGFGSSGIPTFWQAGDAKPGVNLLPDLSRQTVGDLARQIDRARRADDFIIASIHWGPNWGYEVAEAEISFAHGLIDHAGVDLVHGHSSHHPIGGEVYGGKLILYGCGDFLNDYEGIRGFESFRSDLVLLYRLKVDLGKRRISALELVPFKGKNFQLHQPDREDILWLADTLGREYGRFGAGINLENSGILRLKMPPVRAS